MANFINDWGTLLKNFTYIITFIGVALGLIKKLDKINDNLIKIPTIQDDLTEIQKEVTKMAEEKSIDEELIKEIKNKLDEHCSKDKKKQKMALDMARQTLLNEMESAIKQGEVSVSRKVVIGELYNSYIDNGGNGAVHDLWAEFVHLKQK